MTDIPRGTIFGRRVGDQPKSDAEHFIRCPACGGWIDCRDLACVFEHEGPLPHPAPIATQALVRIAALYAIEADIRGLSADERRQARQRRTKPLLDDLRLWLEAQLAAVSGKATIAGAIRARPNR
jgi:hypothetical protein